MNSSFSSTPAGSVSVEDCLQDADSQLQEALQQLANGQALQDADEPESDTGSDEMDPDDLAAAFFAQQAKKKQTESTLPIHPWAKTIFATQQSIQGSADDSAATKTKGDGMESDYINGIPNLQEKTEALWETFRIAYNSST